MRVTLNIPDRVWGQLAAIADDRELKISALIEESIEGVLAPKPKQPDMARSVADQRVNAQIEILRGLGYSAPEISRRVGMSEGAIRYRMKALGLPNVRKYNNQRKAS